MDTIAIRVDTLRRVVLGAVLVVGLALLLFFAWQQRGLIAGVFAPGLEGEIDRSTYQAVFFTGGQVYFGRLSSLGGGSYLLSDVFYLPPDLPGASPRPQVGALIRRLTEFHRPKDGMAIPASSILFFENLSAESEIVQAIARFKSGTPQQGTPATPAPTPPRPSPTR